MEPVLDVQSAIASDALLTKYAVSATQDTLFPQTAPALTAQSQTVQFVQLPVIVQSACWATT